MNPEAPRPPIDLSEPTTVHLIGVGGAGMSSIAVVLTGMGHRVSGSDAKDSAVLGRLRSIGVMTFVGHRGHQIGDARLVVRSSAVGEDNPELRAAHEQGVPVLDRTAFLPLIAARTPFVSISGTHGKTTTSSMTASALEALGEEPSFLVGSRIASLGASAAYRGGPFMVLEADESDGSFLAGPRVGALVTNIEPDHLDHWGDWERLVDAFHEFLTGTDGPRVVCADDPTLAGFLAATQHGEREMVGYGFAEDARFRIVSVGSDDRGVHGEVSTPRGVVTLRLSVPGRHNLLNATGSLALLTSLGHDVGDVARALGSYTGVSRRFEARGTAGGADLVDDYAHHPTELRAAIAAGRSRSPERLVVVFQPHRYTRTRALWDDFARTFDGVDVLVVTDVYPAGEDPIEGVSASGLADAVRRGSDVGRVDYLPTLEDAADHVADILRPGDLIMSLGAGDVTTIADLVIARTGGPLDGTAATVTAPGAPENRAGSELVDRLAAAGLEPQVDHPMGPLCTYRVGGHAEVFVRVDGHDQLETLARVLAGGDRSTRPGPGHLHVIGKGSNLLVADGGVRGLVVQLGDEFTGVEVVDRSADAVTVRVGAAALMPATARRLAADGIIDFEWAVGIPGSLGGAVRMNAGGHGSEMAEVVRRVHVVDLRSGEARWMDADELELGYRTSAIRPHQIVTDVELSLREGDPEAAAARLSEIVRWRREHQPGGPNAGSVFTNPPGDSAGRLIDTAGCRGLRIGSAEVSTKHANFIQADPGGSADDVMALMKEIVARVRDHHGITLHAETVLMGFEPEDVVYVKSGGTDREP